MPGGDSRRSFIGQILAHIDWKVRRVTPFRVPTRRTDPRGTAPGMRFRISLFSPRSALLAAGPRRVRRADPMHATPGVWISPRPDLRAGRRGSLDVSRGGDGRVVTAPTRASGRAIAPTLGTGPGDANLGVQGFASEENFVPPLSIEPPEREPPFNPQTPSLTSRHHVPPYLKPQVSSSTLTSAASHVRLITTTQL